MRRARPCSSVSACLLAFILAGTSSFAGSAFAQPAEGSSTPDRLDFGQVRVGATVEGSVNFFFEGTHTDGIPLQVYPPPFATVSSTRFYHQQFGPGNERIVAAVYLKIATDQLGVSESDATVFVGDRQASVPVRVEVVEPSKGSRKILIPDSPFDRYAGDFAYLERWRELVKEADLDPTYRNVPGGFWYRPETLEGYDAVIVGGEDLTKLSPRDVEAILQFARDGGRVIVAANYFFRGPVDGANQLLEPVGLRMEDSENAGNASKQIVQDEYLADHPALEGVHVIVHRRASPIQVVDPLRAKSLIAAPDVQDRSYAAWAELGDGEIVVLGQSLWASWIDEPLGYPRRDNPESLESDNARFLKNVLTLEDWPALEAKEQVEDEKP
ncbi:MAG TPA: DUF4350 domain-containing protein [Pirellulaceae bacterium]|jgi:hypothetical protein|nr:DUF4350 domain-containing protein [Pirellulaceae bacterium]